MPRIKVIDKKGMDAIFSGVGSQDPTEHIPNTKESGVISRELVVVTTESGVDMKILAQAIEQGTKNPRISSWNPLVMAVLRYRNLTIPAYSMSKEISELLEVAIRERYPLISEKVEKALSGKT